MWTPEKFENRIEIMRELFQEYVDSGCEMPDFSDHERDPFWDPPEAQLLGQSYLNLQNLTYTLD